MLHYRSGSYIDAILLVLGLLVNGSCTAGGPSWSGIALISTLSSDVSEQGEHTGAKGSEEKNSEKARPSASIPQKWWDPKEN